MGSRSGASEVKQHKWFAKINWGLLRNTRPPVSGQHRIGFYVCFGVGVELIFHTRGDDGVHASDCLVLI